MRALLLLIALGCSSPSSESLCREDAECPGGRCVYNICKPLPQPVGATCMYSDDCTSGYCVSNTCTSGELGAACTADFYCNSRVCGANKCVATSMGMPCEYMNPCRGNDVICVRRTCRRLGEDCESSDHCPSGSQCIEDKCVTEAMQRTRTAAIEAEERKQAAAAEARMLEESGVKTDRTQAERTALPAGRGQRVRTVKVRGTSRAFAACRDDERMVGGGCDTSAASYPSEFSTDDTVGARWNCVSEGTVMTAFALCMKVP